MLKIIGLIVVLVVVFIIWRLKSVVRGGNQRDSKLMALLEPIGKKIDAGETVAQQAIDSLASRPEIRFKLFALLRGLKRTDLLPTGHSSFISQGESALAYWLMHPNELQSAPEAIEYIETVKRPIDEQETDFYVYRYRMPKDHWAGKDGWILGLVGPIEFGSEPYTVRPGAFSRADDIEIKVKPYELIDWYVAMLRQKG